ncbi:hypothetical protein DOY81_007638 [Sarcophaga bullata]|nr:hypothetical protein DOY81_007638 [Sarcophaga bullata]
MVVQAMVHIFGPYQKLKNRFEREENGFWMIGLFLAIHYTADINLAFNRVNHICRDDEEFIMDHTYLLLLD